MIRDLSRAVAADLNARKYPYPVTYGPERVGHDGFRMSIVFARDRDAGDDVGPAIGATRPRATADGAEAPLTRAVSGKFTVYARSSKAGAGVADHEDECDAVCDAVLTAMYRVLAIKRLPFQVVESKLLTREQLRAEADDGATAADDHSGRRSADYPGCAARVRFKVTTLVRDVDYTGAGPGVGEIVTFAPVVVDASLPESPEDED